MPARTHQRTYPLRMSPSLRGEIESLARAEQISVNHFISLALAEKLSRLEHESWLKQQAAVTKLPEKVANE